MAIAYLGNCDVRDLDNLGSGGWSLDLAVTDLRDSDLWCLDGLSGGGWSLDLTVSYLGNYIPLGDGRGGDWDNGNTKSRGIVSYTTFVSAGGC